jgi:pimeloyl-ACP methyl ester carboxylesterase
VERSATQHHYFMPQETIVFVHGLWVNGLEMGWLGRQLAGAGYLIQRFSYPTMANTPFENAMDLNEFAGRLEADTLHFVGHSLGGLVIRHLFHHFPQRRPGRIVTLGTPHQGSSAAAVLARRLPGRWLLGRSLSHGLIGPLPPWPTTHALGSIAGTLRLGLGLLLPDIPQPSDGTVAVEETRLAGMADHMTLPASHTSMLFSLDVVRQTQTFLQTGHFLRT